MIGVALTLVACASSGPIPPAPRPDPVASRRDAFDLHQRARLDALRAALAESAESEASSGLNVRLAFEADADLDLFVTDPAQESVYFANSPTRSGGTLLADRRCEDPAPRIETVRFREPIAGRYRVGVDFPRRCETNASSRVESGRASGNAEPEALYLVRVEEGGRVLEREGALSPGLFEVIVLEFDVAASDRLD